MFFFFLLHLHYRICCIISRIKNVQSCCYRHCFDCRASGLGLLGRRTARCLRWFIAKASRCTTIICITIPREHHRRQSAFRRHHHHHHCRPIIKGHHQRFLRRSDRWERQTNRFIRYWSIQPTHSDPQLCRWLKGEIEYYMFVCFRYRSG